MPKTVNMLKYLSGLRKCTNISDSLSLASELGISTLYSSPSSTTTPSDLILSIDCLTPPQPSSFLMPGTAFIGVQQAPHENPAGLMNRDRDYLRRMVANRNLNSSSANLPGSISALMDAERFITDLMEDSSTSVGTSTTPTMIQYLTAHSSRSSRHGEAQNAAHLRSLPPPPDAWPVSVTLHSISLNKSDSSDMSVTGTMSATHIPDKLPPSSPDHKPEGSSMESFFEGEIVDFAKFSLETGNQRYRSGGMEVDARYWRGVGPFRLVTEFVKDKINKRRRAERTIGMHTGVNEKEEDQDAEDEIEEEIDAEMARCLSRKKWVEEKLTREWILMRWKERCFVSRPTPASPTSSSLSAIQQPSLSTSSSTTTTISPYVNGCFGLTISGFYYIALHRASGHIEGLYYDPGSQPYQELRLLPEGVGDGLWGRRRPHDKMSGGRGLREDEDEDDDAGAEEWRGQSGPSGAMGGLKRWFPSCEFR